MKNRVLSLFSGAGGMDLGFEGGFSCLKKSVDANLHPDWIASENNGQILLSETGFETVFANDIRPDAKEAWENYFKRNVYHLDSIVELVKSARSGSNPFPSNIDIITGGFPCNDFSVSGKRLGFNSTKSDLGTVMEPEKPSAENRGRLYMWMRDVITLVKPKMFIAENVKGLTNLGEVKQIIERDFSEADGDGYLVVPAIVLKAWEYGVPQSRERVIFFGFRKSALKKEALDALSGEEIQEEYTPYPPRTHGEGLLPLVTCSDAFHGLVEPEEAKDSAQKKYSKAKYMGKHCQGQTEVKLDSIGPTIRAEHHGNIEYRRLSEEHGGKHHEELERGLKERRLTVRECARIQTFPDDYEFIIPGKVSASDAYKIIGNAVPPLLAYNIAMNLKRKWELYFK